MIIKERLAVKSIPSHYTIFLPVCNEEARIARVIGYYAAFGRIIVIDNYSSDRSAALAQECGCEVYQIANNGTGQTKEWMRQVLALSPTRYVLLLSCSEFIPPAAMWVFEEVARMGQYNMVTNVVVSYTCGADIQLWGGLFGHVERRIERFFNSKELDYNSIFIHAPFKTKRSNDVLQLPNDPRYNITHLRDSDIQGLTRKHLGYAVVEACHIFEAGGRLPLRQVLKRCIGDVIRYLHLTRRAKGLIASRELWARVMLHFMTYYLVREHWEGYDIDYSRQRSTQLWESLVETACREKQSI